MEKKFLEIIKEALELEDRDLSLNDNFKEFDEWDSLALLTIIAELDENYGITIKSEDFKNIQTLQQLYNYTQNGE
jgi:acyl carrier protein